MAKSRLTFKLFISSPITVTVHRNNKPDSAALIVSLGWDHNTHEWYWYGHCVTDTYPTVDEMLKVCAYVTSITKNRNLNQLKAASRGHRLIRKPLTPEQKRKRAELAVARNGSFY